MAVEQQAMDGPLRRYEGEKGPEMVRRTQYAVDQQRGGIPAGMLTDKGLMQQSGSLRQRRAGDGLRRGCFFCTE